MLIEDYAELKNNQPCYRINHYLKQIQGSFILTLFALKALMAYAGSIIPDQPKHLLILSYKFTCLSRP